MLTDLIGGQVDIGALSLPSVQQHLKNGTLRAIGVGTAKRLAAAPEIPTMVEQGLPNYLVEGWFAVIGPARLPSADVARINAAFVAAFDTPEVREIMAKQGNTINVSTPEYAAQFFRTSWRSTRSSSRRRASNCSDRRLSAAPREALHHAFWPISKFAIISSARTMPE